MEKEQQLSLISSLDKAEFAGKIATQIMGKVGQKDILDILNLVVILTWGSGYSVKIT